MIKQFKASVCFGICAIPEELCIGCLLMLLVSVGKQWGLIVDQVGDIMGYFGRLNVGLEDTWKTCPAGNSGEPWAVGWAGPKN